MFLWCDMKVIMDVESLSDISLFSHSLQNCVKNAIGQNLLKKSVGSREAQLLWSLWVDMMIF